MAQHRFTAALNAASFPFLTSLAPRSVVITGLDNVLRDAVATQGQNILDNNPKQFPQILYCENILPTAEGVMSVGFLAAQAAFAAGTATEIYTLRDENENRWLFDPASGKNYVATAIGQPWISYNPLAPTSAQFSLAYVNGITYICYAGLYIGHWDSTIPGFVDDSGVLSGIAVANIKAIGGSGNYLLALTTDNAVHWSSLTVATDFTPSASTGAGTQIPSDIRGPVIYITPMSGGFLIHCLENTVAAIYTNNTSAPWIFREVKNAGGITFPLFQLAKGLANDNAYIIGTAGLQKLSLREAEMLLPQVTDFLGGRAIETFNTATNQLSVTRLNQNMVYKIDMLAGRYLCFSYGIITFTHLLIYDTVLRRWGKIVTDHVAVFSWPDTAASNPATSESLYLLASDGSARQIVMDQRIAADSGVLILGRYQISRSRRTCSEELDLELLDGSETPTVVVGASWYGTASFDNLQTMVLNVSNANYRNYQKQVEGENLCFIIKGSFNIGTALVTLTRGGAL